MTTPMPAPAFAPAPPGAFLRSPVGLGRATAVLLGLVIATDLFAVWADLQEAGVAGDLADGVTGAGVVDRADHADHLYGIAGILQGVVLVATAVVFLCWLWRARTNAEVFDPAGQSRARGWAIGGWFCPVVNLWFPRRIVLDVWDASAPWGSRVRHGLVNSWWALWLLSLFAGRAASTMYRRADSAAQLRDATRQMAFADAVDIVAAVLAVLVVCRLTAMQHRKALAGLAPVPAFG
ncbi:DUF4328 domain-containing protein [Streptomyces sp. CG1]|uniref:DUF4328 domain-containing protein n=1 Tax=Streptomyces sp. CG1 TaxID=1287523 RepID=UPI0034E224C5